MRRRTQSRAKSITMLIGPRIHESTNTYFGLVMGSM
jgi:hypothetical protein